MILKQRLHGAVGYLGCSLLLYSILFLFYLPRVNIIQMIQKWGSVVMPHVFATQSYSGALNDLGTSLT